MIETVECLECGREFKKITNTHLKTHGMDFGGYLEKYPGAELTSEGLKERHRIIMAEKDMSGIMNEYYRTHPESGENQSKIMYQYYDDHPEAARAHSDWLIGYYKDPEVLKECSDRAIQYYIDNPDAGYEHSERMKNSEAVKIAAEKQRGGNDIINHHWLYDDADLSKYTMPMTRSEHTRMHNYMREDGYEVTHINSREDDNGLWGYH